MMHFLAFLLLIARYEAYGILVSAVCCKFLQCFDVLFTGASLKMICLNDWVSAWPAGLVV